MLLRKLQQQSLGAVCTGGAATGRQKSESVHRQGKSSSLLFLNPLSMETCLGKTGLCCGEGGSYSKELELICQIVTECKWLCTWATKGVSRLLGFCVMPTMKLFLSLALMLNIRFAKYILKALALFSIPILF